MLRTSYIFYDDDICFVLDQQVREFVLVRSNQRL